MARLGSGQDQRLTPRGMEPFSLTDARALNGAARLGLKGIFLVGLFLSAGSAQAAPRFDHRGAVGLLVDAGGGVVDDVRFGTREVTRGATLPLELGLTWAVGGAGDELAFRLGFTPLLGDDARDFSFSGGWRTYFGEERFKTFLELDLRLHDGPIFTAGPLLRLGAQYELSPVVGLFSGLGFDLGIGSGLHAGAFLCIGFQLRSYLLE